MSHRSKSRQPQVKIDPYYRFILFTCQQAGAGDENEHVVDQVGLGLSLKQFHSTLEEIPKRCWKKLNDSLEAVLHFSFLFCGVEAFSVALKYNQTASIQLPPKLENELNGLNRLIRKVVKRILDDRDWREDILDVLRQAERSTMLIFYMLKSCPSQQEPSETDKKEGEQKRSFIDAYIKGRLDRLTKQLDEMHLAARTSSNTTIRILLDQTDELRKEIVLFSHR